MLSAAQQERYARHLLLDGVGGSGQEKLICGAAVVDLPAERAGAARWAARYLAASGVGTLVLRGPWAADCARECAALWPEVRVLAGGAAREPASAVHIGLPAASEEGPRVDLGDLPAGASCADDAAAGALAALEALKALAGAGAPAPQPLQPFATTAR